jgi:hypothetical protein
MANIVVIKIITVQVRESIATFGIVENDNYDFLRQWKELQSKCILEESRLPLNISTYISGLELATGTCAMLHTCTDLSDFSFLVHIHMAK